MGRLEGKTAFITGAASGIGRATALLFASEGARVVAADISADGAERTAARIGANALALTLDVANESQWEQAMRRTVDRFGRLDILCNIAGIGRGGSIEDVTLEDWNAMLAVNLTGTMLGCKHGVRTIKSTRGSGAIVNVSSVGGLVGIADIAGYCASKGGVTILTKSVALHCAQRGYPIRCVSVHPTYVDTEMLDPVAAAMGSRSELLARMARQVPMGRVATADDIARTIAFAASDDAIMIDGSSLIVDGAQLAGPPSAHFE
ncbi:SDR family NAD(P)-dependent oxidoreductase [Peristeroidobacter soli]|uniref:SDR family NAD(P)-dependent oxidoreductase n=1 Tax=Peristeroidobacter soli TaxID=2497877 RepID=UPI00101CDE26|nr:SDR family oxidoreductase [Peristeroidobacter soli]